MVSLPVVGPPPRPSRAIAIGRRQRERFSDADRALLDEAVYKA
jgi:hypothetical protein